VEWTGLVVLLKKLEVISDDSLEYFETHVNTWLKTHHNFVIEKIDFNTVMSEDGKGFHYFAYIVYR
jgi:hypothetical protein